MIKKIVNLITDAAHYEDDVLLRATLKLLKNECNLEELTDDSYS